MPLATVLAQQISGHVYSQENGHQTALEGVSVYLPNTTNGVHSQSDGSFSLFRKANEPLQLVFSLTGYVSDTVLLSGNAQEITHLMMEQSITLEETSVVGVRKGTISPRNATFKTEVITKTGLVKLACCNLSESFENSASISVGFTDAVTGAKQVQLLGLSGLYSQMLAENIPTMRGLASTFGWNYLPGTWLESIQILKGASSVVNGYENITGQINLEMLKPETAQPLFINLYGDIEGRYEANVTSAIKLNKLWDVGLLAHFSAETQEHDYNSDGFMDTPKNRLINLYNRWSYTSESGIHSQSGIKFLEEKRNGGQMTGIANNLFSTNFTNRNFTIENKTGIPFTKKEGSSIGIISNITHYEQLAQVGKKTFDGTQNSLYLNIIYNQQIGDNHDHRISVGGSFSADYYCTNYLDSLEFNQTPKTEINRDETVSGLFGEYTVSPFKPLIIVAGIRADYNSFFKKILVSPRLNLKYTFNEYILARASIGRGFRSPNLISENIGFLASSRNIDISNIKNINIESAWNYGANMQFSIPVWKEEIMSVGIDFFHTEFQNQAVVDIERNRNNVFFYNLNGRSFADVFQVDITLTPFRRFDIYTAFRYNNTQITYTDIDGKLFQMEKPLSSRFRGLVNLSYATKLRRWVFDFTTQINGPTRLPNLNGYNEKASYSEVFPIFFGQITHNSKRFDVYLGAENIFNYRQKNPIIDPQMPFGRDFDSSLIWGPLMGTRLYAGIRLRIGELK